MITSTFWSKYSGNRHFKTKTILRYVVARFYPVIAGRVLQDTEWPWSLALRRRARLFCWHSSRRALGTCMSSLWFQPPVHSLMVIVGFSPREIWVCVFWSDLWARLQICIHCLLTRLEPSLVGGPVFRNVLSLFHWGICWLQLLAHVPL